MDSALTMPTDPTEDAVRLTAQYGLRLRLQRRLKQILGIREVDLAHAGESSTPASTSEHRRDQANYHSMVIKGAGITWYGATRQMTFTDGVLRPPNIVTGTVMVSPTANVPTSVTVSGLSVAGTSVRAFVTASSSVPSAVVECTASNVTAGGLTVWLNRTNTTTTGVWYLIIGT